MPNASLLDAIIGGQHDEDLDAIRDAVRSRFHVNASIRRVFQGGSETIGYEEFAERIIQDDDVAQMIADRMLDSGLPYTFNDDQPEFLETFTIVDRERLACQMYDYTGCCADRERPSSPTVTTAA